MFDAPPRALSPAPAPATPHAPDPAAYSTAQLVAGVRDVVDGVRALRAVLDQARRAAPPLTGREAGG